MREHHLRRCLLAAILLFANLSIATAADPVAIVEEVSAPSLRLQPMDYVFEGQKIALQSGESIILGYLASCQRERITGGDVVVGVTESRVTGGEVKRERLECDGGAIRLTADQAAKSGVVVFRAPPPPTSEQTLPPAQVTVFSLYPMIDARPAGGPIIVDRLDRPARPLSLAVEGHAVDLATRHLKLAAGGLYRASVGGRSVVFQVSPRARSAGGPILGRLLRL